MAYDLATVRRVQGEIAERKAAQAAEARERREAAEAAAAEARAEKRRRAKRARYRRDFVPAPRRGYAASKLTNARRSERVRQHRHAQAVQDGTVSPLALARNAHQPAWTQRQLVSAALVPLYDVQEAEAGRAITPERWQKIADALGVEVAELRP